MTTLDHLDIASSAVQASSTAEICALLDRAERRPTLICMWTIDAETGRPVCSWTAVMQP